MHITLVTKLGENIMTDFFFISGHFCAPQDKVVSKSVVFCQILGKQSHEKTKSQILGCFLSFGNCVTSK